MTDDEAVTVVVAMRKLLLQPFQLTLAMGAVARIQEDEQIFVSTDGIHRYSIGRGVEILLEERSAVEVHIMVTHDQETWVVFCLIHGIVTQSVVSHSETCFAALVDHVTGMDGKDGLRVVALGGDVFVEAVFLALWHDAVTLGIVRVGAGIDMVLVRCVIDNGFTVLGVVVEPVGHALFGVAPVDDHASNVKTVAACSKDRGCCDDKYKVFFHDVQFLGFQISPTLPYQPLYCAERLSTPLGCSPASAVKRSPLPRS